MDRRLRAGRCRAVDGKIILAGHNCLGLPAGVNPALRGAPIPPCSPGVVFCRVARRFRSGIGGPGLTPADHAKSWPLRENGPNCRLSWVVQAARRLPLRSVLNISAARVWRSG